MEKQEVKTVKIGLVGGINAENLNPRGIREGAADDGLAASIKQAGILQPLVVRRNPVGFDVIDGNRRLVAARAAGLLEVPVIVVEDCDDKMGREMALTLNLQREDLHPLDEARAYRDLMALLKLGVVQLAGKLGKTPRHVAQRLALVHLTPAATKALLQGEIGVLNAQQLAAIPDPKLQDKILARIRKEDYEEWSPARISGVIKEMTQTDLGKAPFDLKDPALTPVCEGCRNRTSNQPLLFPEAGPAKDACLNPACYAAKIAEHSKRVLAAGAKAGHAVIDPRKHPMVDKWGHVRYDYPYADIESAEYLGGMSTKIKAIIAKAVARGAKAPTIYVTTTPAGHAVELIEKKDLRAAIKAAGGGRPKKTGAELEEHRQRVEDQHRDECIREHIRAACLKHASIAGNILRGKLVRPVLYLFIENLAIRTDSVAALCKRRQIKELEGWDGATKALLKATDSTPDAELTPLVVDMVLHLAGNVPQELDEVVRVLGLDVKRLRAEGARDYKEKRGATKSEAKTAEKTATKKRRS